MTKRIIPLLIVVGFLLSSCDWQMPETVTVKGSPEVYIPSGATVFELDFLDDIATDFGEAMAAGEPTTTGTSLTAGEKQVGVDGYDVGSDFALVADLTVGSLGDLPDVGGAGYPIVYGDSTAPIDISNTFGPVPDTVWVQSAPSEAWLDTTVTPTPSVDIRLWATWTGGSQYLLGSDAPSYETLPAAPSVLNFDVANILNARPSDLVLNYEFGTTTTDAANVDSITIRFEIPFALETVGEAFLDIEDDQGNNELAMDDDIFDRDPQDPDEDLDDFLDALRGSSAELVMKLENTTGFGATLAMVNGAADWEAIGGTTPEAQETAKQDPANWVVDLGIEPAETLQQVQLAISAATLDEIIDGVPVNGVSQFTPEFLIQLPYDDTLGPPPQPENQFSIKKGAAFNVAEGYMRVQADFDYTYSLEDEE